MNKRELPINLTLSETRWGIRYLLFEMVFLGSIIRQVLGIFWPAHTNAHVNFFYFLINFLCVGWIFRRYLIASIRHTVKRIPQLFLSALGGYAAYNVLSDLLSLGIVSLFPNFFNVNGSSISASVQDGFLLMAIGSIVLVPIVEETLFRGLIFGLFHRRSRLAAYAVSSLLFCAIHVIGYIGYYEPLHLLLCFVQYLPAGLALGWAYEFSGSIYAPTLIHMAVNAIGILSMR